MKQKNFDLLLKSYEQKLDVREQALLKRALLESVDLQTEQKQIDALRRALLNTRPPMFDPYFSTRVLARLRESAAAHEIESFFESLKMTFRVLILTALLLTLGLMSYNAIHHREPFLPGEITVDQALDPAFAYFQE